MREFEEIEDAVNALMTKLLDIEDKRQFKTVIRNIKKRLNELERVTKKIDKI